MNLSMWHIVDIKIFIILYTFQVHLKSILSVYKIETKRNAAKWHLFVFEKQTLLYIW